MRVGGKSRAEVVLYAHFVAWCWVRAWGVCPVHSALHSMGSYWLGAVPPPPAAPEQLLGERCTFAADIYRWGRLGLCCCGPADCHLRLWECVIHCCAPYWLLKCTS